VSGPDSAARGAELRRGQRTALVAALATVLLAALKGSAGYFLNAPILVADAYHSMGDIVAVAASAFGLWLAGRRRSERFPYGLLRAENLAGLLVGLLILFAGAELLRDGYSRLLTPPGYHSFPLLPLLAGLISAVVSFLVSRGERRVAREINSGSLAANGAEAFLDVFSSAVVVVGILLAWLRVPYVQGAVIMLIALLILRLGLVTVWGAVLVLVDANLDPELQEEITREINEIYGVRGVGDVRIRRAGPFQMVECTITTKPSLPLYEAHRLADEAETSVLGRHPHVESVFVHVEPAREGVLRGIIPVQSMAGLDSRVSGHFGRSRFFAVVRFPVAAPVVSAPPTAPRPTSVSLPSAPELEIEDFYLNEFLEEEAHVGLQVFKAVVRYRLDVVFTEQIGEIAFSLLRSNFVDVYSCPGGLTVSEVVARYRLRELSAITAATHPSAPPRRPSP
jgi:cation diffusion facilitator family transporter